MPVSFDQLNPKQKLIVRHESNRLLLLAGPGTGKTEVIAHRISFLLNELQALPQEIVALTFSKKAASEMLDRLSSSVGSGSTGITVSTIHAESLRLLQSIRLAPRQIASERESRMLMQDAIDDMLPTLRLKECQRTIAKWKAKNTLPNEVPTADPRHNDVRIVYERYERNLEMNGACDMDGLVLRVSRRLTTSSPALQRVKYLLIDEYQDVNSTEHQFIRLLSANVEKLFVVGDDDQSIYGWRGADPRIIRGFSTEYPDGTIETLEESNRCCGRILAGAIAIVSREPGYVPKPLRSSRGAGSPIHVLHSSSENKEAFWIGQKVESEVDAGRWSLERIAVICKRLDLAEPLAKRLRRIGTNFSYWKGNALFSDDSVTDVLAHVRLLLDRNDNLALRMCIGTKSGIGIGSVGIRQLRKIAEQNGLSFWEIMNNASTMPELARWDAPFRNFVARINSLGSRIDGVPLDQAVVAIAKSIGVGQRQNVKTLREIARALPPESEPGDLLGEIQRRRGLDLAGGAAEPELEHGAISIMSMHSSKGLNYDVVFILGLEDNFPDQRQDIGEQRRLLYVAMTRARNELFLCNSRRRIGPPRGFSFFGSSSFLREIASQDRESIDNT